MAPDLIAGRYRVQRAVGRGGMGIVWLCRDELLGRDVAVKQVGRLPGESSTHAARAMREARSSAALNHRNVVSIFDVVDSDDDIWLVMEYVPSRTLSEILREDGPLPPQRAARIGAQVADGLAAAHALGTMHRDVKPGNILVGEGDLAKVSDFGIARSRGDEQLTQTGLLTGTPSYFSPELARGEDPGPEADVWALGATLYAAVEGRPPFPEQRNPISLLHQIASETPPPPTHAGPLAGPIARMMDRNTASRWTMADAAHALRRLVDPPERDYRDRTTATLGAAAPRDPIAAQTRSPAAGALPAAGAQPATGAATGAGAVASALAGRAEDREAPRAPLVLAVAVVVLALVAGAGYLLLSGQDPTTPSTGQDAAAGGPNAATTPTRTPSRKSSPTPPTTTPDTGSTTKPQDTPSASTTPRSSPSESATREAPSGQVEEEAADFVEEYFETVPGDLDTGWSQLAPSMQAATGRASYDSFWSDIEDVDVASVTADPGAESATVSLTYRFTDGREVAERQSISLERAGDGFLISGNTVLSSGG